MNYEVFFSVEVSNALRQPPPGAWIPQAPVGCIRLHAGYPAPSVIPVEALADATRILAEEESDRPLQYTGSSRVEGLMNFIQGRLQDRQMVVSSDELLVTAGAAQAIDLCARVLLDSQSAVAVEAPTYMEALEMFRNYTEDIIEIPLDDNGLNPDALREILLARLRDVQPMPKLVYTIPSFQNPTGSTMTLERRKDLLQLAEEFNFLILEDDAYGELFFEWPQRTLKSLDEKGRVIYLGSLSKVVAPGLRIGWAAGPSTIIQAMAWFKKDLDHPFITAVAATYLEQNDWAEHTARLRSFYKSQRDVMLEALHEFMPDSVQWRTPEGGYFIWVQTVGVNNNTVLLLEKALQAGVSFIPGTHFFKSQNKGQQSLRLSYSYVDPPGIREGVRRLSAVVKATI